MITVIIKITKSQGSWKIQTKKLIFIYFYLFASESIGMLSKSTNDLPMIISHKYGVRGPVGTLREAPGAAWSPSALQQRDQTHLDIYQK